MAQPGEGPVRGRRAHARLNRRPAGGPRAPAAPLSGAGQHDGAPGRIRLVVVDDHPLICEGIRSVLSREPDIDVVGTAVNGEEALRLATLHAPDVMVIDLRMPVMDGLALQRHLRERGLPVRTVILTVSNDPHDVVSLLAVGAAGYVLKDAAAHTLAETVRAVAAGHLRIAPEVAAGLTQGRLDPAAPALPPVKLTPREWEVLHLLAHGCSSSEIAAALSIGVKTVETHRTNLHRKLDVHSVGELLMAAVRRRLIPF